MPFGHGTAVAVMVAATFLWSTAGVVTRQLDHAKGFEITFWRSFFTLLSLLVLLAVRNGSGVRGILSAGSGAVWVSGVCWSVMFTAFMVAMTLTSVANVLVTMALGPLLTALAARLFIGHRLPTRTWVAIGVAGGGIVWMYGTQLGQGMLAGTLVAFCVPLAAACNWTLVQHAQAQGRDVDLLPALLIGAGLSAVTVLPLAMPFQAGAADLAWLAFLGLFQLAIPCALAVTCARVLSAAEVSLLALLEVVFGIALAWLGAGERPSAAVLAGGGLVVGALIANECWGMRRGGDAAVLNPGGHAELGQTTSSVPLPPAGLAADRPSGGRQE